jgi:hypothetical protein
MFKTIYLEADEEITSVIDKVRKTKGQNIALVFPKGANLIQSIVNLKLLKKQTDLFGKNIVIVTSDETGQNLAKKVSFAVTKKLKGKFEETIFKKIEKPKIDIRRFLDEEKQEKAPRVSERISEPKKAVQKEKYYKKEEKKTFFPIKKEGGKSRVDTKKDKRTVLLPSFGVKSFLIFCAISFIVVGIIFFVILPKATVSIVPKTEPFSGDLEMIIDKGAPNINPENKIIPGELKIIEDSSDKKKFDSTGEKDVGEKARGEITLYNKYSSDPQVLVAATRFDSQGKIFYSLSEVTIPGAQIEGGETIAGQTKVLVEAEKPGEDYNIGPSNFIISGLSKEKQKDIFGKSDQSFSGGTSKKIKIVTADDLQKAKDALLSDTFQKRIKDLAGQISKEKMFIENTARKEITETKTNGEQDREMDNFEMEVKVKIWVMIFNRDDLRKTLFSELKKDIPQEKFFIDENVDEGLTFDVSNFDSDNGKLVLKIHAKKVVAWKLDEETTKKAIKGKTKDEVKTYLSENPNIRGVNVSFWPFWVKKVPRIEKKIEISLDTSKIVDTIE